MSGQDAPLLEVRNLRIGFRDRDELLVDDLSFDVRPGSATAIVGESGSGKSLTTRALTGLLPVNLVASGSAVLAGRELVGAAEAVWRGVRGRAITLLPQDPFTMLSPLRRVSDQLRDGARTTLSPTDVLDRLREVGIADADVADRYPFQLSGGLRQRVGMAAALAGDPDILLADEPSTALDVTTQRRVLAQLQALRQSRNLAVVLVTHDLRVAFAVADTVVVLYAGRALERGPARELEHAPLHPYTAELMRCEPSPDVRVAHLAGIAGSVPRAHEVAGSCAFAPRCEHAEPACVKRRPPLVELGRRHDTACLRAADLRTRLGEHRRPEPDDTPSPVGTSAQVMVAGLSRTFAGSRGRRSVPALRDVSLHIAVGESVGIVGESGSGKTTLSRIIAGLETSDAGSVTFAHDDRGRHGPGPVQIVFQDPALTLNPARKVGRALTDALRAGERPVDAAGVAGLLETVGLPAAYADRKPAALSGGERQRVAIARAIASRPRLLLCDEPVSALDVSVQAQVLALLRRLQQELQLSLLFITHDLAVVRQVADRLYVLQAGRIVEHGAVADVLDHPQHPYTRELMASIPRSEAAWLTPVAVESR